jgi:hypothetical protein
MLTRCVTYGSDTGQIASHDVDLLAHSLDVKQLFIDVDDVS